MQLPPLIEGEGADEHLPFDSLSTFAAPPHDYRRIPIFVAGILQTTRDVSVIFFQACWNIKGKDFRAGLHLGAFASRT